MFQEAIFLSLSELEAGDIIFEFDELGKIINESSFLYAGNAYVFEINAKKQWTRRFPMESLSDLRNPRIMTWTKADPEWSKRVAEFFAYHDYDFRLAGLLVSSMRDEDDEFKIELPRLIPRLDEISKDEYEKRWDILLSLIQAGDLIFTTRTDRRTSQVIQSFTHGPWSHIGTVLKEGMISEMLTSGFTERAISVYRDGKTRIGLYRPIFAVTPEQINRMREYTVQNIYNTKYGYRIAVLSGLLNKSGRFREGFVSPMDLVYGGKMRMVHFV